MGTCPIPSVEKSPSVPQVNSEPCQVSRRQDCREIIGGGEEEVGYTFTESLLSPEVRDINFNQVPEIHE